MKYSAASRKENNKYYPVVKFYSPVVSDSYVINEPQESRSKALTIAKQTIKRLEK